MHEKDDEDDDDEEDDNDDDDSDEPQPFFGRPRAPAVQPSPPSRDATPDPFEVDDPTAGFLLQRSGGMGHGAYGRGPLDARGVGGSGRHDESDEEDEEGGFSECW